MKEIVIKESLILVDTFKRISRTKRIIVSDDEYKEYKIKCTEKAYQVWRESIKK